MAPATALSASFRAVLRILAVVLASVATPVSLAAGDDHPVSRKLDHVRHTRVGAQRLDVADAPHHEFGAGHELVDLTPVTGVVTAPIAAGPDVQTPSHAATPALGEARQTTFLRRAGPPGSSPAATPPHSRPVTSPPGRAPPAA